MKDNFVISLNALAGGFFGLILSGLLGYFIWVGLNQSAHCHQFLPTSACSSEFVVSKEGLARIRNKAETKNLSSRVVVSRQLVNSLSYTQATWGGRDGQVRIISFFDNQLRIVTLNKLDKNSGIRLVDLDYDGIIDEGGLFTLDNKVIKSFSREKGTGLENEPEFQKLYYEQYEIIANNF